MSLPPNYSVLVELGLIKPSPLRPGASLSEARSYVRERLDVGTDCPCCGQYARRYVRKLNSGMARTLIWLVGQKGDEEGWVDVPRTAPPAILRSNEHGKLVWWGLAEAKPTLDTSKRHSGVWRPTQKGVDYVFGRVLVQSKVILYDNLCEGFEGEEIPIWEALGKRFNYQELMDSMPGLSGPWVKSA